jgi:hypothetical protein
MADGADTAQQRLVGDLVYVAVKADQPLPTPGQIRNALHLQRRPDELPSVAEWLAAWLGGRKTIKPGTHRSYAAHIRLYLVPYLGQLRLDRLRPDHIDAMFDGLDERNTRIRALRADADQRERVRGLRVVGPATMHRIHATLRKALNDAIRKARLIDTNPALFVELPTAKTPRALVWTGERVAESGGGVGAGGAARRGHRGEHGPPDRFWGVRSVGLVGAHRCGFSLRGSGRRASLPGRAAAVVAPQRAGRRRGGAAG